MSTPRDPLTRYWFIGQLAAKGMIAKIDSEGYITRPLRPHAPVSHDEALRRAFRHGDNTHTKPDWWW